MKKITKKYDDFLKHLILGTTDNIAMVLQYLILSLDLLHNILNGISKVITSFCDVFFIYLKNTWTFKFLNNMV